MQLFIIQGLIIKLILQKKYIQNIRAKHAKHKIFQNHFENKVIITRKNILNSTIVEKILQNKTLIGKNFKKLRNKWTK